MKIYDSIGKNYSKTRRSDPRLLRAILSVLESWEVVTIADLGAGTGSYAYALAERNYNLVAIEPSAIMRSQAIFHPKINWVNANAESLPLSNGSVDAVIIILAIHHFKNYQQALQEAYRVTENRLVIIFTYDPEMIERFWLTHYFPSLITDVRANFISIDRLVLNLENIMDRAVKIVPFLLPNDLVDSFAAVGWARPELYLDSNIRQGISAFSHLESTEVDEGVSRLRKDLESGRWEQKYGYLRHQNDYDAGYRIVYTTKI